MLLSNIKFHSMIVCFLFLFPATECPSLDDVSSITISGNGKNYQSILEIYCDTTGTFEDGYAVKLIECNTVGDWNDSYVQCGGKNIYFMLQFSSKLFHWNSKLKDVTFLTEGYNYVIYITRGR